VIFRDAKVRGREGSSVRVLDAIRWLIRCASTPKTHGHVLIASRRHEECGLVFAHFVHGAWAVDFCWAVYFGLSAPSGRSNQGRVMVSSLDINQLSVLRPRGKTFMSAHRPTVILRHSYESSDCIFDTHWIFKLRVTLVRRRQPISGRLRTIFICIQT
jgi:hypothetical protein